MRESDSTSDPEVDGRTAAPAIANKSLRVPLLSATDLELVPQKSVSSVCIGRVLPGWCSSLIGPTVLDRKSTFRD